MWIFFIFLQTLAGIDKLLRLQLALSIIADLKSLKFIGIYVGNQFSTKVFDSLLTWSH